MNSPKPVTDQPAWDLSREYASLDDPLYASDLQESRELAKELEAQGPRLSALLNRAEGLDPEHDREALDLLRRLTIVRDRLEVLTDNLRAFANCLASVDGKDGKAKEYRGIVSDLGARMEAALAPLDLILARCPEAFVAAFLEAPETRPHGFRIGQLRKYRSWLLGLEVEAAISRLGVNGPTAWSRLYDSITGTATCAVEEGGTTTILGLAQAASILRGGDRPKRAAAFKALAKTYAIHEESLSAILNALAGWRLSEYDLRSTVEPYHFLDSALAQNHLSRRTLDTMLEVVRESKALGQRALALQARLLGVDKLSCYDLLAPCPAVGEASAEGPGASYTFAEGLALIREAYARVDPAMGDFVTAMAKAGNIEARSLPNKRQGAYCTSFTKSREPKVFQTYGGSLGDVSTLAHELGHAYHESLMRDLHPVETHYPMNLAETASTFAETALAEYLADAPGAGSSRLLEVGWSDAQDAVTFLLNIPTRFYFEKAFYEARREKPLGAKALSDLMGKAWDDSYGDSLADRDCDFWKGKLHFYMAGRSFYNFPYTFGYLFSLGVYAQRAKLGAAFPEAYKALLLDTGRMESEDLAKRHLGVDLGEAGFWKDSLAIIKAKLDRFEALL